MRTDFDFAPYRQSTVGFDRIFDQLQKGARSDATDGYPPFDLVRDGEGGYRIDIAVAGYNPEDVEVIAHQNQLSIAGRRPDDKEKGEYLHRGIAARSFERRFALADFIEVASADFNNGLLSISLKRVVPDEMKPRKIAIGAGVQQGKASRTSKP